VRAEAIARAILLAGVLVGVLVGCAPASHCEEPPDALDAARAYVGSACVRRAAMEGSVAAADTPYAEVRLAHYALGGAGVDELTSDWDALPVFVRRVRRLRVRDGSAPDAALEEGPVLDAMPTDLASYVAAGERAFTRYPIQIDLGLAPIRDRATAERIGMIVGDDGLVEGVVEVETETGWNVSLTCASCHARHLDGELRLGLPNERLDLGGLFGHDDWPVGTVDVTDDGVANPIRPSDLRPITSQARLQHTGNLFNGRIARMVRIETLMIGELSFGFRPERDVVAAIALYLEALGAQLPPPDESHEGAAPFASACGGCHRGVELAGPPVPVEVVGTDATATIGGQRGTGSYRAPSLLGASERRGVLHDGSAADLRAILGLDPSAHVGHAFGLERSREEREAIAAYLGAR
jgi:hypothetical protein